MVVLVIALILTFEGAHREIAAAAALTAVNVRDANASRDRNEEIVSDFMKAGRDLVEEIRRSEWSNGYLRRVNEWVSATYEWLKEHRPDLSEEFLVEGFPIQGVQVGSIERANKSNYMERRLWRLKEIHDKMQAEGVRPS